MKPQGPKVDFCQNIFCGMLSHGVFGVSFHVMAEFGKKSQNLQKPCVECIYIDFEGEDQIKLLVM